MHRARVIGTIDRMSDAMENSELLRKLENTVRFGSVAEVSAERYRLRVQIGEMQTDWVRWFQSRAGDVRSWSTPYVGEQCIVFAPAGDLAAAVAFVGFYSDAITPPESLAHVHATHYPDGAFIRYDHQQHALTVTLPEGGTADVTVPDSITVRCKTAHVTADDSITVQCDTADVTASSSVMVHSQLITLDAPESIATGNLMVNGLLTYGMGLVGLGVGMTGRGAIINGPVEVINGNVTLPGNDVVAKGVSLVTHHHTGVWSGSETSGPPTGGSGSDLP